MLGASRQQFWREDPEMTTLAGVPFAGGKPVDAKQVLLLPRVDAQGESMILLVIDQEEGLICFLTFWAVAS